MSRYLSPAASSADFNGPVPSWLQRQARRQVFRSLQGLRRGSLRVVDPTGRHLFGTGEGTEATVQVHDARFYPWLLFGGSLGGAEAYIRGYWSSRDLTALIRLFVQNLESLSSLEGGFARFWGVLAGALHRLRRNSRGGARKNIAEHYDLGNPFFSLFLDPTMSYSCGVFERPASSLRDASLNKMERVCRKLQLRPTDHLLEIGGGWGGLAQHAAVHHGCRVTTTTISRQQYDWSSKQVQEAGLEDRVTVLFKDYRDLEGDYDKLVSIEMIEAVGQSYLDTYFNRCCQLLRPRGLMVIQAITIADRHYRRALRSVDFIKEYVFPGSELCSVARILESTAGAELSLRDLEDLTTHYPPTLRAWRRNFLDNQQQVRNLGYSESFLRLWDLYFCYCEAGFLERYIGNYQFLFRKADLSPPPSRPVDGAPAEGVIP